MYFFQKINGALWVENKKLQVECDISIVTDAIKNKLSDNKSACCAPYSKKIVFFKRRFFSKPILHLEDS